MSKKTIEIKSFFDMIQEDKQSEREFVVDSFAEKYGRLRDSHIYGLIDCNTLNEEILKLITDTALYIAKNGL